jgi:hypothetical protein
MDIAINVPVNPVSFGQVGFNLLKEAKLAGHNVAFFPISEIDTSTFDTDKEMVEWIAKARELAINHHNRNVRAIKLWHLVIPDQQRFLEEKLRLNGSYDSISNNQTFLSFYELDQPSQVELNVARNFDTVFSSKYTCEVFAERGVQTRFVPLAFDKLAFKRLTKKYYKDDRIAFCLLGKFEHRKNHVKCIQAWIKRFGNDRNYYLQCAIYNPFFNPQVNMNAFRGATNGKHYWNVNFMQYVPTNAMYNDFLNSNHIVLAMSGGEGWGLPEFHTVGLGKHAVVLNAHAYKGWANSDNAVLVNALNKVPAYDGIFFKEGLPFNQGNIFSFDDDEFIAGCEAAIKRYQENPVNSAGLKLQDDFTYEKTLQGLINV